MLVTLLQINLRLSNVHVSRLVFTRNVFTYTLNIVVSVFKLKQHSAKKTYIK